MSYLISGVFGVMGANLAFASCIGRGGPRRAELLSTSGVLFSAVFGFVFLKESMSWFGLVGCLLIASGILLAIICDRPAQSSYALEQVEGALIVAIALGVLTGFCQAIGLLVLKRPMANGLDPIAATTVRLGVCSGSIALFEAMRGRPALSLAKSERSAAIVAIVPGFLGYVVASALLFYAVGHRAVAEIVVLGSLSPILILPLQWVVTRQRIGWGGWFGAALALGGIYLLA
jgi:drug/metabolite transporter (DMT)-like permease